MHDQLALSRRHHSSSRKIPLATSSTSRPQLHSSMVVMSVHDILAVTADALKISSHGSIYTRAVALRARGLLSVGCSTPASSTVSVVRRPPRPLSALSSTLGCCWCFLFIAASLIWSHSCAFAAEHTVDEAPGQAHRSSQFPPSDQRLATFYKGEEGVPVELQNDGRAVAKDLATSTAGEGGGGIAGETTEERERTERLSSAGKDSDEPAEEWLAVLSKANTARGISTENAAISSGNGGSENEYGDEKGVPTARRALEGGARGTDASHSDGGSGAWGREERESGRATEGISASRATATSNVVGTTEVPLVVNRGVGNWQDVENQRTTEQEGKEVGRSDLIGARGGRGPGGLASTAAPKSELDRALDMVATTPTEESERVENGRDATKRRGNVEKSRSLFQEAAKKTGNQARDDGGDGQESRRKAFPDAHRFAAARTGEQKGSEWEWEEDGEEDRESATVLSQQKGGAVRVEEEVPVVGSTEVLSQRQAVSSVADGEEAGPAREKWHVFEEPQEPTAAAASSGGIKGSHNGDSNLTRNNNDNNNVDKENALSIITARGPDLTPPHVEPFQFKAQEWFAAEGGGQGDGGEAQKLGEGEAQKVGDAGGESDSLKEVAEVEDAAVPGASNDTKSLQHVQTGLETIRTIETEVEKHVDELLDLFTADKAKKGGGRFQAAAAGVRQEVDDIRAELVKLLRMVNTTTDEVKGAETELQKKDAELVVLHAIEDEQGARDMLEEHKVKVDYTTGKIQWEGHLKDNAAKNKDGRGGDGGGGGGSRAGGGDAEAANVDKLWRKKVEKMKEEWDPAVLHLDPKLLRDFVILFMSATLGGVCAAGFGLPDTLGYIVGGMIVGPTGVDVIRMVKEVQTFAQFGSIFLLFGHGLLYSTFIHAGGAQSATYAPQGRMGAFTVLFVVFSALLACITLVGIDRSVESVFLAAAATLSSTAMVTEFVAHSRLGDTLFARMVVDLVSVQDLVMCPLLAIPTAIMYAAQESSETGGMLRRVTGCTVLLLALFVASKRLLPALMQLLVLKDKEKEQSSGLFTLGVVSYCLGVALVCERTNLSHEAGALFAGLLMVESPYAKQAHACMQPLTSLFGGIYLGSLGMIVNPMFIIWHFGEVFGCVMLLVLIKFVIVAMVMKSFGFTWEASTLAGACMAQVSEISLFFIARGHRLEIITRHHYLMAVATTIILMVANPLVIKGLHRFSGFNFRGTGDMAVGGGGGGSDYTDTTLRGGVVSLGGGSRGRGWLSPTSLAVRPDWKKHEGELVARSATSTRERGGTRDLGREESGLANGNGSGDGTVGRDGMGGHIASAGPGVAGIGEGGGGTRRRVMLV